MRSSLHGTGSAHFLRQIASGVGHNFWVGRFPRSPSMNGEKKLSILRFKYRRHFLSPLPVVTLLILLEHVALHSVLFRGRYCIDRSAGLQ